MALYQINGSNGTLGRVVDYTIREERIMSDVWDNVYYATVMNADGTVTTHRVGVCGCKVLTGEVDAEEEVVAAYQKYLTKNKIDALRKDMERALFDERKRQATPKRGLKEWFAYNELWEKKGYVCRFFHQYTEQDQREGPLMLGCPIRLPHVNPERAIHNARVTLARFSQEIGVYFRTPFVLIEEFGVY